MRQLDKNTTNKPLISVFEVPSIRRRKKKEVEEDVKRLVVPTPDEIENFAAQKLKSETIKLCDVLYYSKIFTDAPKFRNAMLKRGKNPRAILHTLTACYKKRFFGKGGAWAYCTKIIQVEDGNFNERDHNKTSGDFKNIRVDDNFKDLLGSIGTKF